MFSLHPRPPPCLVNPFRVELFAAGHPVRCRVEDNRSASNGAKNVRVVPVHALGAHAPQLKPALETGVFVGAVSKRWGNLGAFNHPTACTALPRSRYARRCGRWCRPDRWVARRRKSAPLCNLGVVAQAQTTRFKLKALLSFFTIKL